MKILFDINHPAHVHFFHVPIVSLIEQGHDVLITSRNKEIATELLDQLAIKHIELSAIGKKGTLSLLKELVTRDFKLWQIVRKYKPDVMASIGGIFIAHVSLLTSIPSLVFYDTENARLQNALTYPFASCVIVPDCYQAWLPKNRFIKYPGYHELAYLHPDIFQADHAVALKNGLAESGNSFLIRTVSWQANHDVGENGWSLQLLEKVINFLLEHGKVIISSETELPDHLKKHAYRGKASEIHHLMAFCRGFVGESATMASECAVLGVPAIYAAETGRGYTDELESRYGLVSNCSQLDWPSLENALQWLTQTEIKTFKSARQELLTTKTNVSEFVVDCILHATEKLEHYQNSRET